MKDKDVSGKANKSLNFDENAGLKMSLRDQYVLEVQRIKNEIGDLEQIRLSLGLSARRLCKLLLVDPSAWTRWIKSEAPPHVYQALKWLLELKKTDPEAILPSDLTSRVDYLQHNTQSKIKQLEDQISILLAVHKPKSTKRKKRPSAAVKRKTKRKVLKKKILKKKKPIKKKPKVTRKK